MNRRLVADFSMGIVFLCFYVISYTALTHQRSNNEEAMVAQQSSGVWNLPPVVLRVLAGEFKGLMADYLTLEVGAQLGTKLVRNSSGEISIVKREYDWPSIHRLFVASQALDPSFAQTYVVAQGWLPWDAKMVSETQEILRTAAINRPWDWQPQHAMGFNAYYFLQLPGEAGRFFLEAAKIPNAPSFLAILGARLAQKGGETEAAIIIMKSMLADKNPDEPGYADMSDRLKALEGVLTLERASLQYKDTYGQNPAAVDELTSSGILVSLPDNPYNLAYCIDTEGIIYFDNPQCQNQTDEAGKSSH